jgi:hypothetical protein
MRVLHDPFQCRAVLFDPATKRALPLVFCGYGGVDAELEATAFLRYIEDIGHDPRELDPETLEGLYARWTATTTRERV